MNFPKIKSLPLLAIVLFALVFVFGPSKVFALSISPVRLEISGDPGETLIREMTLTNDTQSSQIYYSSFANFEAQGETGNPSFVDSAYGLNKWMSAEEKIALAPGASLIVPIKITIPIDADPGGHFAAVFWGTSPNTSDMPTISIGAKVGMLVLLSVNGEIDEAGGLLEFSTFDNKFWYNSLPISFKYRFSNEGSDRIKPMGKARIRNTFFIPIDKVNANPSEGNILPGSVRRFEFDWIKHSRPDEFIAPTGTLAKFFDTAWYQFRNFAVGLYSAKLNLTYGSEEMHAIKTTYFFVFPWQMLICLIVILTILFWGISKLIRRYNRYIIKKARFGMNLPNEARNG